MNKNTFIVKKIILLILIGLSFFNCTNDDNNLNTNIIGQWNWISSSGGIAGITETPESTGDVRKLEISVDSLKGYLNGNLNFKMKYTTETRQSGLFNETREMIIQENEFRLIIEFNEDNLILIGDCNDCFTSEYEKE